MVFCLPCFPRKPDDKEAREAVPRDRSNRLKEVRILLLGTGESGKSTIVKQMKIIHQNGYTKEELLAYRTDIFRNVLESMKQVIVAMNKLNYRFSNTKSNDCIELIKAAELDLNCTRFPAALTEAVAHLWVTSGIRNFFDKLMQVNYVIDSAPYFFDEIERIGAEHYIPNETDVLRARIKSTGISETRFTTGPLDIHMIDVGGQRPERKKWIHRFDNVTSIIFCVALSEYDQVLLEDASHNRLLESFIVFESIINSRWFAHASILLFLNKIDIFRRKLVISPLERYFDDYHGGTDYEVAANFLKDKFLGLNHSRLLIYPHFTCATDTKQIETVFAAVRETILANALRETGIL